MRILDKLFLFNDSTQIWERQGPSIADWCRLLLNGHWNIASSWWKHTTQGWNAGNPSQAIGSSKLWTTNQRSNGTS
jgi:hypothetical protein